MLRLSKRIVITVVGGLLLLITTLNVWGLFSQGTLAPAADAGRDPQANRVVMVFGATGAVGDGLLEAAMKAPDVKRVHVVTRRTSPRIEAGSASGRVKVHLHEDFTRYDTLGEILGEVSTVLWGLGTSSLNVDDATYTRIHVDYPVAFVTAWLQAQPQGPLSFHYVTGMGTDPDGSAHWAREKGRTERELAALARGTQLRTFSYRSGFIRPTTEQANLFHYLLELLLRPGQLVIPALDLGRAMLEISARTGELPNGTLIDTADSIAYARAWGGSP